MIRNKSIFPGLITAFVALQLLLAPLSASAATSGPCYFGSGPCGGSGSTGGALCGTNDVFTGRGSSLVGGYHCTGQSIIYSKNTKTELVNFIKSQFNSSNNHNETGAKFIVNEMLGRAHNRPNNANLADWVERMNDGDIQVTTDDNRGIGQTSYYDPGKNDDFYADGDGPRDVIVIRSASNHSKEYAVIERLCGNLLPHILPLPDSSKWGAMTADTTPNKTSVAPGGSITWHHKVWDTGSVGNDQTDVISGDVYWGAGSTGPIPASKRYGGGKVDNPKLNYSRKFIKGSAYGVTKSYTFTVPSGAHNGDKYCQYISYDPTSSKVSSSGKSPTKCVTVGTPPPATGSEVATCSLALTIHGPIEVSTKSFAGNYSASVTSTRHTKDERTNPESWSAWSGWSGWSGSDVNQTRTRTRTATADRVYFRVVKAYFTSSFDGSNTASGRTSPQTSGNLSPYNTSYTFPFSPEDDPGEYTAGGNFTYTVEKVVEHYKKTQTETERRTRTKRSNGTYTAWVDRGTTRSGSGWVLQSSDVSTVGGGTVDCGEDAIKFALRPYMSVYGGDIMAGAYQADLNTPGCTQNNAAGIISWNHNRNEVYNGVTRNDFAGAGAEAGAFALAHINSFASALKSGSGANGPASGLSFANTTGVSGTQYGGSFGSIPLSCNFAADKDAALPITNPYGGAAAFTGQHTYMTSGNVYISGNVVYNNSGGWIKTTDIPRFKLLVTGNIYIGANVTELDGLYVATDSIYTCATGPGSPTSDYDTCNNPLKVYGAFAAKKINFLRTKGTLRDATPGDDYNSDNIGETFIYTPELWLPNEPNSGGPQYDSILGLPPVL